MAWGWDGAGQTDVPAGLTGVTAIAASGWHSLALKNDGTVVAWGDDSDGQTKVPAGLSGVTAIAAGDAFNLALRGPGAQATATPGGSAAVSEFPGPIVLAIGGIALAVLVLLVLALVLRSRSRRPKAPVPPSFG